MTLRTHLTTIVATTALFATQGDTRACDPEGHLDVGMELVGNAIETGVYVLDDPQNPGFLTPGVRVWGGRFQTNPFDPFFTDDPGFGAVQGSGLPAGSQIGFNTLADLLYWDGTGSVTWTAVPNNEQLRIKFGFQSLYVGTGTGVQSGFAFDTVGSNGDFHRHLSFFLYGADGNATPADQDGVEATEGVYLLQLEVTDSSPAVDPSDRLYFVFANFDDPAEDCLHCAALNHVAHDLADDRPRADLDFDRDVDADDLARLQACATGPAIPWTDPCCQPADLDEDGDIDQTDFGLLQRAINTP